MKTLRKIGKIEFFLFKFHFISNYFKIFWQLEAVQTLVTKGREMTDLKQTA